jgi:exopolysaccharide production protein ExoQ
MMEIQAARRRDALSGRAATLAVAAFVLAPVGLIDPLALAPVFTILVVTLLVIARDGLLAASRPLLPAATLLLPLAAWATVSASWSILPQHSLLEGLRRGAIAIGGLVVLAASMALDPQERRFVAAAAAVGLGVAAALLLAEDLSAGALARVVLRRDVALWHYHRGATVMVLALWPVLVASSGPLYRRLLLAAVAGAAVLDVGSGTAALALVAGLAVFAVAWWTPRVVAASLALTLVAFAVAAPLAIPSSESLVAMRAETPWIKWSGMHRLLIWRFTSDRIADHPLLGWGMDASREIPGGKTRLAQRFPEAGLPDDAEALPLHPHDAVLQWELELGVPGTVLCLALAVWGFWRVGFAAPLPRLARAGALGWGGSALVIALLAYGAWQAWWLAALFMAAATFSAAAGIPAKNADIPARDRP